MRAKQFLAVVSNLNLLNYRTVRVLDWIIESYNSEGINLITYK